MTDPLDPVDEFARLCRNRVRPNIESFIERFGKLSPQALLSLVRIDQRDRWRNGERISSETYFQRFPVLRTDPELAVDVVYNEYLLVENEGGTPARDLARRFPDLAETLDEQVRFHEAMTPSETVDRVATLPRQFGRYELQRQLGKGGMGTVYLARDTQLERLVALKVPNLEGDPSHARQFLREARAAAALHHPNICPVYDSGEIDGRPFLTMAYVEGEPLSARVSRGPLPIDEATSLVRTLADALDEAHRAGVVHRDLKPANILYNSKGQPVITDFGLARRSTSTSGMSSSGQGIFGTPAYMAPEQVNGDSKTIGPTSDVYALGVVLYELLTGTRPFDGTLGTLLARITTEDTEPPSRRRPEIDERLDALCLKALAKKPNERFKSMAAFAAAIDDWQAGPTITIVSRPSVKKRKASRRGIWLTAGVGAAAVAIVVTAVLIAGNGRASRTDPTSIAPVVKKEVPAPKSK